MTRLEVMYTDVLIRTIVITTVTAWSFWKSALNICFTDTVSTSTVDIEKATEDKDTALQIHLILHELQEPYKEVFQLRVFGELSFHK